MDRPPVIVYTTTNCARCFAVKRFLRRRGVPFREISVFRTPGAAEELVRQTGALAAPVTVVGRRFVRGADFERLDALLCEAGWVSDGPPSADGAPSE
ncbi:MAG: glutaredoxin family protein [Alicyclobacillus sp.]|nr:glutaredoxin family protein [Alicyclobacillus sp.]